MVDILVEGGIVLTMDPGRRIIPDGAVAVEGNRIAEVGSIDDLKRKYQAPQKTINAKNKLVMPGLIDTHTHLFSLAKGLVPGNYGYGNPWIQRTFDLYGRGRVTKGNHYVSCLLSCAEMIRGGIKKPGYKPGSNWRRWGWNILPMS